MTTGWEVILAKEGQLRASLSWNQGLLMKDGVFVGKFMDLSDPRFLLL